MRFGALGLAPLLDEIGGGPVTPDLLVTVTTWCAEKGVLPEDLQTGTRSLEDVFVDLTRKPTP